VALEERAMPTTTTVLNETSLPNNTAAVAQPLATATGPVAVRGALETVGDADFYSLTVTAPTVIWAYLDTGGNQAAGATSRDARVILLDAAGTVLLARDNGATANGGDATIEAPQAADALKYTALTSGTYFLKIDAGQPGVVNPYMLYIHAGLQVLPTETEPNNNFDTALAMGTNSETRSGSLGADPDFYKFVARSGDRVWVQLEADTGNNLLRALAVDFYDTNRNLIFRAPANIFAAAGEAFSFNVPVSGTYYFSISDPVPFGTDRSYIVLVAGNTQPPADTTAPVLLSATGIRLGNFGVVSLAFNEALNPASVQQLSRYLMFVGARGKFRQGAPLLALYDATSNKVLLVVALKKTDTIAAVIGMPGPTDLTGNPVTGLFTVVRFPARR
jgi:hypothetical protein